MTKTTPWGSSIVKPVVLNLVLAGIALAQPISIVTPPSLPTATVGLFYNQSLSATGGTAPYTWRFGLGAFRYFLTVDPQGVLRGTPSIEDGGRTYSILLRVSDSASNEVAQTFTISVVTAAPLVMTTRTPLPAGIVRTPYSTRMTASGGTQPFRWSVTDALPPGLRLDVSTGAIDGTPVTPGTYDFRVNVMDAAGVSATGQFSITVTSPLLISTSTMLPDATAGSSYTNAFAASGGTPPYTNWSALDTLPAGLSLSTAGTLSGVPGVAGAHTFRIQVTDSAGVTAQKAFTLRINPPALAITTASPLPEATAGAAYGQSLAASGGTPPYANWSALDTLPVGLSLSTAGTLSGVPGVAGAHTFRIQVTDSAGVTAQRSFVLRVGAGVSMILTTASPLPDGTTGAGYTVTLAASGGVPSYSNWTVISGALPPGLALNATTGAISGTPNSAGTYTFRVHASDSAGTTAEKAFDLTISTPGGGLRITSESPLPNAYVGLPYSFTFAAAGGTPEYRWRFPLGGGVAFFGLDPKGVLSGTPRASDVGQSYTFDVVVIDAIGQSAQKTFTITFLNSAELTITTGSPLPTGTIGVAYNLEFSATGGRAPYTRWAVLSGQLPPALAIGETSGALSGVPPVAGSYTFVLQVTDSALATAQKSFQLTISDSNLVITTSAMLPVASIGVNYTAALAATGGSPPYRWSVVNGALPGALALDPVTARISGTPATAGTFQFTLAVSDTSGLKASKQFTLVVTGSVDELIIITPRELPSVKVGAGFVQTIMASGGKPPYGWRFPLGESAAYLSIDAQSGVLSGVPTHSYAGQTLEFRIMVTDSAGQTALKRFRMLVVGTATTALRIVTNSPLPDGFEGLFYLQQIAAEGGAVPYRWSVLDDTALPPGIVIESATGSLYGVASAIGTFQFIVKVLDAGGATDQKAFQLEVKPLENVIPAGPMPPLAAPVSIGVDSERGRVFLVNRSHYDVYLASGGALASDAAAVLDVQSGKLISPIFVGKAQSGDYQGIAVDSARRRVYVPNADDNSVSVIDPAKNTVVDTLYVGSAPTSAAVEPASGTLYVTNSEERSVSVIDSTGAPIATLSLSGKPLTVVVDRTSQRAYVLMQAQPWTVVALEGATKRGEITLPSARNLRAIAVDPGVRLYAADSSGQVYMINLGAAGMSIGGSFTGGDSPANLAVDPATHQVYITNFGSSTVKSFSAAGQPLDSYDVLKGPTGITIDEAARKAYVADTLANSYSIIDLRRRSVENSAPVGSVNTSLAFDRVTRSLYAANLTGNAVAAIDPVAKKVLASWPCGDSPWTIAVDGVLRQIYAVNVQENAVAVISSVDGTIKKKLPLPESLTDSAFIAVNTRNHRVYVTQGSGVSELLTIIDGLSNVVVKTVRTGRRPVGIAVDEAAGLVYVANINSGTISVLNADSEQIVATWDTNGMTAWALAIDPAAERLYVTIPRNTPADFRGLIVMDSRSGKILSQVKLGSAPQLVVVNATTGHAFISDADDGTVTAVDGSLGKVIKVFPVGNFAYAMAIDPESGTVYLANGLDGTINIIHDAIDLRNQN